MKRLSIILVFLSCLLTMEAQENSALCSNQIANEPIANAKYFNRVYATSDRKTDGIEISINNTTKDTIYLFSSYLKDVFYRSRYLNRVDKKRKINKLSLLPLPPFISTKYADNIVGGENALVCQNQILYHFIVIPPNLSHKVLLPNDIMTVNKVTKDFDLTSLHLFSKLKFKVTNLDGLKKMKLVPKIIEFAIYRDIKMLCNEKAYYLNIRDFDIASKNYEIIKIQL